VETIAGEFYAAEAWGGNRRACLFAGRIAQEAHLLIEEPGNPA
jgi:hypothetical protein